jgi:uncharacterized membrane protein
MLELITLLALAMLAVVVIALGVALGLHAGQFSDAVESTLHHAEPIMLHGAAIAGILIVLGIIALLLLSAWKACRGHIMAVGSPDLSRQPEA